MSVYTKAMTETQKIDERVSLWLETLTERYAALGHTSPQSYRIQTGRKYDKVVDSHGVHAFYDNKTGDVYKAATWRAPAKHVRFNLLDDESFAFMLDEADPYGSYLYLR